MHGQVPVLTHQIDGDPPCIGTLTEVAAIGTVDHAVEWQAGARLQRRSAVVETLDSIGSAEGDGASLVKHMGNTRKLAPGFQLRSRSLRLQDPDVGPRPEFEPVAVKRLGIWSDQLSTVLLGSNDHRKLLGVRMLDLQHT